MSALARSFGGRFASSSDDDNEGFDVILDTVGDASKCPPLLREGGAWQQPLHEWLVAATAAGGSVVSSLSAQKFAQRS